MGLLGLAAMTAAGCSSGGGARDAAADYLTFDVPFGDLPPGCPPAAANEQGIGTAGVDAGPNANGRRCRVAGNDRVGACAAN